jgi:hypothetical protein
VQVESRPPCRGRDSPHGATATALDGDHDEQGHAVRRRPDRLPRHDRTHGNRHAVTPASFAVTFDTTGASGWLHTTLASGAPTGSVVPSTGSIPRTTWTGGSAFIPADVLAVPGVSATDSHVGQFPAHVAGTGVANPVAYAVVPAAPAPNDELAPGEEPFTFGADVKLDTGTTASTGTNDNGNNVVQRGLSGGDQYKIQIDAGQVSCMTRSAGTIINNALADVTAGTWQRIRCTRTPLTGGGEQLDLVVSAPDGTVLDTDTKTSLTARAVLDFATAKAGTPIPFSVGAKVGNKTPLAVEAASDQFNGRIDNVYLDVD